MGASVSLTRLGVCLAGVQMEIGDASGGTGGVQLNINYPSTEASDWELHSVLVWDSALSTATMKAVTAAMREVSSFSLCLPFSLSPSLSVTFPGAARSEALLRRTRSSESPATHDGFRAAI